MKKILLAILFCPVILSAERAKEGYCKFVTVSGESTETIVVVPNGKRFVLRKLYAPAHYTSWQLTVNDVLFMDDSINVLRYNSGDVPSWVYQGIHDFPDQCVVLNSGQTLKAENSHTSDAKMMFIGYLENVGPISDLNGDGKVDLLDFAKMASEWLEGA